MGLIIRHRENKGVSSKCFDFSSNNDFLPTNLYNIKDLHDNVETFTLYGFWSEMHHWRNYDILVHMSF